METRVAVIGIIVENMDAVEDLNSILHEYGRWIIGRMGIPYRERKISVISIAVDAPQDVISSLTLTMYSFSWLFAPSIMV